MINEIKEIYNEDDHDGVVFLLDENDNLEISPFTYVEKEDPIEVHELGYKYHVILYKETFDGEIEDLDKFEAILGNPHHYVGNLIKAGFLGSISKKTKSSFNIINDMFDDLLKYKNEENTVTVT